MAGARSCHEDRAGLIAPAGFSWPSFLANAPAPAARRSVQPGATFLTKPYLLTLEMSPSATTSEIANATERYMIKQITPKIILARMNSSVITSLKK